MLRINVLQLKRPVISVKKNAICWLIKIFGTGSHELVLESFLEDCTDAVQFQDLADFISSS